MKRIVQRDAFLADAARYLADPTPLEIRDGDRVVMSTGCDTDWGSLARELESAAQTAACLREDPGAFGASTDEHAEIVEHARGLERAATWLAEAIVRRKTIWR